MFGMFMPIIHQKQHHLVVVVDSTLAQMKRNVCILINFIVKRVHIETIWKTEEFFMAKTEMLIDLLSVNKAVHFGTAFFNCFLFRFGYNTLLAGKE